MVSIERAWSRVKDHNQYRGTKLEDLRHLVFGQTVVVTAAVGSVGPTGILFPEGAIVLGIAASAYQTTAAANDAFLMRKGFALNFSFAGGDSITPGGPISADALMGSGEHSIFPSKELVVEPSQQILTTVKNLTSDNITVIIAFHSLVKR